jgi:hypothetical protein
VAIHKALTTVLAVASVGALAACSIDKEADTTARTFNDELRAGTTASDTHLGAPLQTPDAQAAIAQMHGSLPTDTPTVKNTGFNISTDNGNNQMSLTYEYDFAGGKVYDITDVLQKNAGQTTWSVIGFKVDPQGAAAQAAATPAAPAANAAPQDAAANAAAPQDAAGAPPPASNAQGN